ncbi:MAG TPA: NUDIX hydrolase [Nocardioidaceae bacterium]|nr:NUDIX hydrolase [Nocardioidaceae bacterium]
MDPRRRLPAEFIEGARGYVDGSKEAAPTRDASTVVLMRDGTSGPEVYLLKRHLAMATFADFCVFPGGGVDPRDFDHEIAWAGPSAAEWGGLLDCGTTSARALVCAAVRETFEECGVLLAGPTADTVVEDTTGDDWEVDRQALEGRELSFTDFLSRRGLVVRTDLLRYWGRWITPVFEPKRFDTRFFVAVLPEGQVTRDVSTESAQVAWMPAAGAVAAVDEERIMMLPPTYCTCMEVSEQPTAAAVLASTAGRDLTPIQPTMVYEEDGSGYLELPAWLVALGERIAAR